MSKKEFVIPHARILRLDGRVIRIGAGATFTLIERKSEFIDPKRREISRGLAEKLFPTISFRSEEPPPVKADAPAEEDTEEDLNNA